MSSISISVPGLDPREPCERVFRTADEWAAWWKKELNPGTIDVDPPEIDFRSEMVVVAAGGTRPNTAYSLGIVRVEEFPAEIRVTYEEGVPGPNTASGQALTYPYHAVRIPRSGKPVTFIRHVIQPY